MGQKYYCDICTAEADFLDLGKVELIDLNVGPLSRWSITDACVECRKELEKWLDLFVTNKGEIR